MGDDESGMGVRRERGKWAGGGRGEHERGGRRGRRGVGDRK